MLYSDLYSSFCDLTEWVACSILIYTPVVNVTSVRGTHTPLSMTFLRGYDLYSCRCDLSERVVCSILIYTPIVIRTYMGWFNALF